MRKHYTLMRSMLLITVFFIFGFADHHSNDDQDAYIYTPTLKVKQINNDGFNDEKNRYAWASAIFHNQLYVATLNTLTPFNLEYNFMFDKPVPSEGVQIWKATMTEDDHWHWSQVLSGGMGNTHNFGIRKMIVVGDHMYAAVANYTDGFELWSTTDGDHWKKEITGGYGDPDNSSGRGLAVFNGYLYIGVQNGKSGAKLLRREIDPISGELVEGTDWQIVIDDGLGNGDRWFSDLVEFNGSLYMGALNITGMHLYKSDDGETFNLAYSEKVLDTFNTAVMKLYVFNDYLYVGSQNFVTGAYLYRTQDGDNYETLFKDGGQNGETNHSNQYFWYMIEFNGRLYVATYTADHGYQLFSSATGEAGSFEAETLNGLNDPYQIGIRTMQVFDEDTLILGTAQVYSDGTKIYAATAR